MESCVFRSLHGGFESLSVTTGRLSEIGKLRQNPLPRCRMTPRLFGGRARLLCDMETLATAVRCELTQLAPGGAAEVVHFELASG